MEHDDYLVSLLRVRGLIGVHFDVVNMHITGGNIRFEASARRGDWKKLRAEFISLGYTPYLKRYGKRIICTLAQRNAAPDAAVKRERKVARILFICTIITTVGAGFLQAAEISKTMTALVLNTLSFPFALLFILGSHEMAHKVSAHRNGIDSTPPYFIPAPTLTGTFGAVIRIKAPMPDENAAVEMGLSGPVAGFLATIPVLFAGMMLSRHVEISSLNMQPGSGAIEFGEPLLFKFAAYVILGIPRDHTFIMHPLIFAAWVGMLITMLNLLPIGQLDGGHIAHALLGPRRHFLLSHLFVLTLFGLGAATGYYGWFLWALLTLYIVSRGYPPTNGVIPPLRKRNILYGVVAIIIFVLCFMPSPIKIY